MYNNYNPYINYGFRSKFNLNNIFNTTQKVLNITNQVLPIIKEVRPIMKNARTVFNIAKGFSKINNENNPRQNIKENNKTVGPNFFI